MDMNQTFSSKYLKASDLQGQTPAVVIDRITMENIADGEHKPVIYFQGKEKGIVLNKTNATNISDHYGSESDNWSGKPVVLFTTWVDFNGKSVEAIRIRVEQQQAATNPPAQAKVAPDFSNAPENGENPAPSGVNF